MMLMYKVIRFSKHQRTPTALGSRMAFSRGSCGNAGPILGVQEHRRETSICHIDVIGRLCSKNQRYPTGSDGQVAFPGGSRGNAGPILRAQEHRRETLICDVHFLKFDALGNQRTPGESGDQRALLETP